MLFYVCGLRDFPPAAATLSQLKEDTMDRVLAGAAAVPISKPPVRHSLKGAKNVLYLDFNGHVITGTAWNTDAGVATFRAQPFDIDDDPTTFSEADQDAILDIWARVAEDFAPFNIDVTTEEPAKFGPTVARAVITDAVDVNGIAMPYSDAGGVAYVDKFGRADFATYSPVLVYYRHGKRVSARDKVADSVSHEFGHNLGLSHDGLKKAKEEYYAGHGWGETSWGPIMGSPHAVFVTQWSKGEYYDANNLQDDIAIITSKLGLRKSAASTSRSKAKVLKVSGRKFADTGILGPGDSHWYSFTTAKGKVTVAASPFRSVWNEHGGNVDLRIDLVDADGKVVKSSNPSGATSASLSYKASKGVYYLRVRGAGEGFPHLNPPSGYTSYGSVGQYGISGKVITGPPVITSAKSVSVVGGASFTYKIEATNSPSAFAATGLPAGLKLDKKTGVISGRPTKNGKYSVKLTAKNGEGSGKATLVLKVKDGPPTILSQSTGLKVLEPGSSTTLKVSVSSVSGTTKYQWYLNGQKVSGGKKVTLKATASGYYVVKVTNSAGSTRSKPVFVRVVPKKTALFAWGLNTYGQSEVPANVKTAMAVAQGHGHSLALLKNGTVVGWGRNDWKQATPPAGLKNVVDIAAGGHSSVALKSDGTVVTWGYGSMIQPQTQALLTDVVGISAGADHVLALKSNGTVIAWGDAEDGQTLVPEGLKNVVAVAAGDNHSLALKSDGTVVSWGAEWYESMEVPKNLKDVVEIAAGDRFSIARKSDGSIVAWGRLHYEQDKLPVGVSAVRSIAAGRNHVVAITKNGKTIAMGNNDEGQTDVPSRLTNSIAVTAGRNSSIAIQDNTH